MARVEVKLYPKAQEDLEEIWLYTLKKWGSDRAENYIGGISKQFEQLAEHPGLGRKCDYIRKDTRRIEFGKHIIFYVLKNNSVVIARILHESMDVPNRL